MGTVDDPHSGLTGDGTPDTYAVSDTRRGEGTEIGVAPPERVQELIEEHPDACRAFQIKSAAGYVDPNEINSDLLQAEHAGRIEIDPERITDALSGELCSCQVRLDTSDPQLVTVAESSSEKQVEIDDAIARFTPPTSNEQAD